MGKLTRTMAALTVAIGLGLGASAVSAAPTTKLNAVPSQTAVGEGLVEQATFYRRGNDRRGYRYNRYNRYNSYNYGHNRGYNRGYRGRGRGFGVTIGPGIGFYGGGGRGYYNRGW